MSPFSAETRYAMRAFRSRKLTVALPQLASPMASMARPMGVRKSQQRNPTEKGDESSE